MTHKQHRLVLVLVAALALSGAVACVCCPFATDTGVEGPTPAVQQPTQPVGVPTKPAAPSPTKPPDEEPTPVPMGSTTAQSFRFLFDTESADGSSMKVEGALAATAMYMKSTVVSADGKEQEAEIYYVDEYMYTKDSSGQWQKLPFKQTQLLDLMKTFDFNKLFKEAQDEGDLELKLVGADVVRGVPCAKYEFVSKDPDSTGKGLIYLGVTDGLIYRMEGESTSAEGLTKVFMEYWDYNKDIVIEAPS